jgi:hypothetical protein
MRRYWKRILFVIMAIAGLFGLAAWAFLSFVLVRPTNYQPSIDIGTVTLRTWPEHDAIYRQTVFPYVFATKRGAGELLYIGVKHASDASDPQLAEIERHWSEFRPTIAFCEGRARMNRFSRRPTSGSLNESTLVRILAYRGSVPLYTLEPPYEAEVAGLLRNYEPKLVATYLTLRVYTAEAKGYNGDRDALALSLMHKRIDVAGLHGTFSTVSDFDAYWHERFATESDWRTLADTERVPLLVEVGHISREIRGEHAVRTLTELVRHGERVLAVMGASHVIRQEPALLQALDVNDGERI